MVNAMRDTWLITETNIAGMRLITYSLRHTKRMFMLSQIPLVTNTHKHRHLQEQLPLHTMSKCILNTAISSLVAIFIIQIQYVFN